MKLDKDTGGGALVERKAVDVSVEIARLGWADGSGQALELAWRERPGIQFAGRCAGTAGAELKIAMGVTTRLATVGRDSGFCADFRA